MKQLLPIGSVVLLTDSDKKLMVIGRLQKLNGSDKLFDYASCVYPEGLLSSDANILFDHELIERVYFIGFQDEEELEYSANISAFLEKQ